MSIPPNILAEIRSDALARLEQRWNPGPEGINLYLHLAGIDVGERLPIGLSKAIPVARPSVLVLLDLAPRENWGHPCEYALYDARTGAHYASHASRLPPPAFFHHPEQFALAHGPVKLPGGAMPDRPRQLPRLDNAIAQAPGRRYAILFSGISNQRHLNDLEFLYRTLVDLYGFKAADLTVLNFDGTTHYVGGTHPPGVWPGDATPYRLQVDGPGTKSALEDALDAMSQTLQPDDLLLIHTNGQGGGPEWDAHAWLACHPDAESFTAAQFGAKLGALPAFRSLVVMMEQPNSGGFEDAVLSNSTAAVTTFAAACGAEASSAAGRDFDPFARDWIAGLAGANPNGSALSLPLLVPASLGAMAGYANAIHDPDDSPVYADNPEGCGADHGLIDPLQLSVASVTAVCDRDGRLGAFLVAGDGSVWNLWQTTPGAGPWSQLNNLGGVVSQLCAASNTDGRLELFGIGSDQAAYNNWEPQPQCGPWSGWNRLGGIVKQLAVIGNSDGRLELFGIGADDALYNNWQTQPDSGPWSGWNGLGGSVKQIAVVANADGRLEVFGIGADDALWHCWQTAPHVGPWSAWEPLNDQVRVKQIAPAVNSDGRLEVFAISRSDELCNLWQMTPHSGPWSDWNHFGGTVQQIAAARNADGRLEVFGVWPDHTVHNLWQIRPSTGPWSAWNSLQGSVVRIASALNSDGRLEIFGVGTDQCLYNIWQTAPQNGPWSDWNKLT